MDGSVLLAPQNVKKAGQKKRNWMCVFKLLKFIGFYRHFWSTTASRRHNRLPAAEPWNQHFGGGLRAAVARARRSYKTSAFWHSAQKVRENVAKFERSRKRRNLSQTAARHTLRTVCFQGHKPTKPVTATTRRFKKHVKTTSAPKCAKTKSLKFVGKMSDFEHGKKIMIFVTFENSQIACRKNKWLYSGVF